MIAECGLRIADWRFEPRDLGRYEIEEKDCGRGVAALFRNKDWPMTRQQILDLYFLDARCKLIEIAAFLDRVDRGSGEADFRLDAFRQAMRHLAANQPERAKQVLTAFSDPTTDPIPRAPGKGAVGAWPGGS